MDGKSAADLKGKKGTYQVNMFEIHLKRIKGFKWLLKTNTKYNTMHRSVLWTIWLNPWGILESKYELETQNLTQ